MSRSLSAPPRPPSSAARAAARISATDRFFAGALAAAVRCGPLPFHPDRHPADRRQHRRGRTAERSSRRRGLPRPLRRWKAANHSSSRPGPCRACATRTAERAAAVSVPHRVQHPADVWRFGGRGRRSFPDPSRTDRAVPPSWPHASRVHGRSVRVRVHRSAGHAGTRVATNNEPLAAYHGFSPAPSSGGEMYASVTVRPLDGGPGEGRRAGDPRRRVGDRAERHPPTRVVRPRGRLADGTGPGRPSPLPAPAAGPRSGRPSAGAVSSSVTPFPPPPPGPAGRTRRRGPR